MKIVNFSVTFNDLYFWGRGWKDTYTMNKWGEFWKSAEGRGIFWTHFEKDEGFQTTRFLVNTNGSIYLHPMGFSFTMANSCCSYGYDKNGKRTEIFPEIEELVEICKRCAVACGGQVEFGDVNVYEIDERTAIKTKIV